MSELNNTQEEMNATSEEIEKAMCYLETALSKHHSPDSLVAVSSSSSWSIKQIVETLRERVISGDWGQDDIPEYSLMAVVRAQRKEKLEQ